MNAKRKQQLEAEIEYTIGVGWYRSYAEAAEMVISGGRYSADEIEYLRREAARWDRNEKNTIEKWGR